MPQAPLDVQFDSHGMKCSAYLYRPATDSTTPIIVMAHGLGGTRRMRLTAFAERFVAEGYACLVFDYRYFGDSEGQPRQLLDIKSQLEDWKAAVAYARSLDKIDPNRVVIWGLLSVDSMCWQQLLMITDLLLLYHNAPSLMVSHLAWQ